MSAQEATAIGFYVKVRGRENSGRQYEIGPNGLLVGRSTSCDVRFRSPWISRRHAYFYADQQQCYVEDLGSKNGILVNGAKTKKARLHGGDVVDFGPSRFTFRVRDPRSRLARWLVLTRPDEGQGLAWAEQMREAVRPQSFLALVSLVFGILTYLHWAFGPCAVVLALLAFWETRGERSPVRRALLAAALTLGLFGGALNAWFEVAAPRMWERQVLAARAECKRNLQKVQWALEAYHRTNDGQDPGDLQQLVEAGLLEAECIFCPGPLLDGEEPRPYLFLPAPAGAPEEGYAVRVCDADPANHQDRDLWALRRNGGIDSLAAPQLERLLHRQSGE